MTTLPPKKPAAPRRKRTVKKPAADAPKILATSADYILTSREAQTPEPEAVAETPATATVLPPTEEPPTQAEPDFKDLPPLVGEFISKQDWTETAQHTIPPGNGIRADLSGEDIIQRVKHLNRSMGWILISAGVVGVVIPGIIGTPFVILGGLVLWPGSEKLLDQWRKGHHSGFVNGALRQVNRYLDDIERRYPGKDHPIS